MKIRRHILFAFLALGFMTQVGCAPSTSGGASAEEAAAPVPADSAKLDPTNPTVPPQDPRGDTATDVLIFNGIGVSTSDWQNTEKIVKGMGLTYRLVNSSQLDAMSLDEMGTFGMFLVPGGVGSTITNGLKPATRVRVRQAVRDEGVSYLGICAGAFVAVEKGFSTNNITTYGFPVVEGSHLPMWYPNGNTSAHAAMANVSFATGKSKYLVWYGGPSTPEWEGGVIARYSNGKPAMSQTMSGKGFVIVSGPHPEAPQGWRNSAGNDPDGLDYEIMQDLVRATLERKPLPAY